MPQNDDTRPRDLRRRLAVLRETALQLLGECAAHGPGGRQGADLTVALQSASNQLGVAEAALAPSHPAPPPQPGVMTPAPIEPAVPAPAHRPATAQPRGAPTPISAEAAIALALAETTVPFAASREDEAERWLRVLRQEGYVGRALQALGVDEAQLATRAEPRRRSARARPAGLVGAVAERAGRLARQRGGHATTTLDVLFAVIIDYGRLFDRALYVAGISRRELIAELTGRAPVAG